MSVGNGQFPIDISASGDSTIIPGQAGRIISVSKVIISAASSVTIQFKSGSSEISGPMTTTTMVLDTVGQTYFTTNTGDSLVITLGSSVQVGGTLWAQYQ